MLSRAYDVVVAGGGPAGVASVGALLHFNKAARILWLDPDFSGGRISKKYRDVSSNTKTALFLDYAKALAPFRDIISSGSRPEAIKALESLNQNRGCRLRYASDMVSTLGEGLRKLPNVTSHFGTLAGADYQNTSSLWQAESSESRAFEARRVVFATGSSPANIPLPTQKPEVLDLDTILDRALLRECLPSEKPTTIGIIGTSHSAIVVLMNLYELATTTHPQLRIKWFVRSGLTYAEQMDGWILRDNTGLKGLSAEFAREHLEPGKLETSPVGKYLTKVECPDARDVSMSPELDTCQYLVEAIGYNRDPLPQLSIDGSQLKMKDVSYDPERGSLRTSQDSTIPHAYGAGIAFPERVTDPAGNTEYAVGMWKFMKYLKKVVPNWA